MSKLEKRLREAAESGELSYLSVVPVAGKGPNDIVFLATYSPASRLGNSVARNADPAVAILEALETEPPPAVGELVTAMIHKPRTKTVSERVMEGQPVQPGDGPGVPSEPWDV